MLEVKFYDTVDDSLLKFAVIISQSNGKWVFCKHKERDTYEAPGGHREVGEDILETAKRELQEETGAIQFDIKPICVYSVTGKNSVNETGEETFGLLCFAEITEFSGKLESEIEKVELMDELPESWTYPMIQPKLIEKYLQIERQYYSQIQLAAKQTIEYIKNIIKPGMNLLEIRKLCEGKLLELGADSFWYWDVGAFVFAGDETTVSVSGKQYVTSDRVIGNNDIITIDLSPQVGNIWGAIREAKEEVGVDLIPKSGQVLFTKTRKIIDGKIFNDIMDVWLFEYDGEVDLGNATTDEVAQVAWMNREQIKELLDANMFVDTLEYFFTEVGK